MSDILYRIAFIPLLFAWLLFFGFMRFLTPFGFLYAFPVLLLIVGILVSRFRKQMRWSNILQLTTLIGSWLSLIVWYVSSILTPVGNAKYYYWEVLPSVARAGFPFAVLEIPPPALGSDIVPMDMWPGVFANHFFWLTIGLFIATCLIRMKKLDEKKLSHQAMPYLMILLSIVPLLLSLAMFTIWFD